MPTLESTPIPGLLVVRLDVNEDSRGWFKEAWQRATMTALGLPDFEPVQHNVSFNTHRGATRGIHAEPWDKLVSLANGRAFGAWVDLRPGSTFGTAFHLQLDPSVAVFVPRGVGNSYQTLTDGVVYAYLVNEHWRPGISYPALDLGDPVAAIPWPIPLAEAEISDKDQANPPLAQVRPIPPLRTLITGSAGQLGRALSMVFPEARGVDVNELDAADVEAVEAWPWPEYDLVLNAAAFTAVDAAETPKGRTGAWAVNAVAPGILATAARDHRLTVVHYSTDYVFNGERRVHVEDERASPLNVYGQTKAAGEIAVAGAGRYYILRTSWLVGDGDNFVRTMARLAADGVDPEVVCDQVGRLTFADELARATHHLLDVKAPFGSYNVTNDGHPMSWADIARRVFELTGHDPARVRGITTEAYSEGRAVAPRPRFSTLDLGRLRATGFEPRDADEQLVEYLAAL